MERRRGRRVLPQSERRVMPAARPSNRAQYDSSIGQHPSCYRKKIGPPFRRPVRRFCRSTGRSTRKLFLSARWNLATV